MRRPWWADFTRFMYQWKRPWWADFTRFMYQWRGRDEQILCINEKAVMSGFYSLYVSMKKAVMSIFYSLYVSMKKAVMSGFYSLHISMKRPWWTFHIAMAEAVFQLDLLYVPNTIIIAWMIEICSYNYKKVETWPGKMICHCILVSRRKDDKCVTFDLHSACFIRWSGRIEVQAGP